MDKKILNEINTAYYRWCNMISIYKVSVAGLCGASPAGQLCKAGATLILLPCRS